MLIVASIVRGKNILDIAGHTTTADVAATIG